MGILDEAIREHLDLKRRRGADPGEVARQEGEVFGPSRRAAAEAAEAPEPALEEHADGDVAEQQTHLRLADEPAREPAAESEPEFEFEPEFEPDAVPPPEAAVERLPVEPEPTSQETRAFDAEEVRAAAAPAEEHDADAEGESDDVLDETPEFLAETPEHDRLWFEQRPPRDFDF